MNKKQLIVALGIIFASLILFSSLLVLANPNSDYLLLRESCGVYQVQREYQDGTGEGIEIDDLYGEGKVRVKQTKVIQTIRGLGVEDNGDFPSIDIPEEDFPLKVGAKWGEPEMLKREDNMYCNYVEKVEDVIASAGVFKDCFKIVFRTLPDDTAEWFCPGVGIVKIEYHHHGTIDNWIIELKEPCKNE